jgi:hypothetical protein
MPCWFSRDASGPINWMTTLRLQRRRSQVDLGHFFTADPYSQQRQQPEVFPLSSFILRLDFIVALMVEIPLDRICGYTAPGWNGRIIQDMAETDVVMYKWEESGVMKEDIANVCVIRFVEVYSSAKLYDSAQNVTNSQEPSGFL